ncbi:MAG: biotin/lipoyl-binding protein [Firmicutes bacterium]|nr:biotin/lipoyl-binding protein [Bacillota bacterium]
MKKYRITVDGKTYVVEVEELESAQPTPTPSPSAKPSQPQAAVKSAPKQAPVAPAAGKGAVTAPMPGTVLKVIAAEGDTVSAGQPLLILEAMKMENKITAPAAGTVSEIAVSQGQSVDTGQLLVRID